jgi:hypothetical protein
MQRRWLIHGIDQSYKKRKKEENTKKKKRKKRIQKREKRRKRKRKRKREDTYTIVDEQPSTLGELDFRKVLGYRSP